MGQTNVAKRIGVEGKDEYAKAKKLLSELVPVQKAFDRRVVQEGNNQMIGLGETGLVAGAIARGDAAAIAKAGIAVGIKRLLSRPGGAAILYQTGQKLESPVLQKLFSVAAKTGQISMLSARLVDAIETAEGKKKDLLEKKLNEQLDKEQNMEPMGFVATTQQGREQ
jgi:hypothetical protein